MLKRQLSRSASICDGFRQLRLHPLGEGISTPPGRDSARGAIVGVCERPVTVTVNPRSLDLHENPMIPLIVVRRHLYGGP